MKNVRMFKNVNQLKNVRIFKNPNVIVPITNLIINLVKRMRILINVNYRIVKILMKKRVYSRKNFVPLMIRNAKIKNAMNTKGKFAVKINVNGIQMKMLVTNTLIVLPFRRKVNVIIINTFPNHVNGMLIHSYVLNKDVVI